MLRHRCGERKARDLHRDYDSGTEVKEQEGGGEQESRDKHSEGCERCLSHLSFTRAEMMANRLLECLGR